MIKKTKLIPLVIISCSLFLGACGKLLPFGTCIANQTTFAAGQDLPIKDGGSNFQLAQTFVASQTLAITTVQAYLTKVGAPGDSNTITAALFTNNSTTGQPSGYSQTSGTMGTPISSGSILLSQIGTTGAFVSITVSSITLNQGTTYWLVLAGSYAQSSSNNVKWARSSGSVDVETDGQAYSISTTGGSFFTSAGFHQDFAFRVGNCSS